MTRKKVKLAYITNDAERRASFRKRKKGLMKKVRELSTLCDIQACAIIYSPYDPEPEVWPSRAGVLEILTRYRNLSDVDKTVKTVNQESFTRQRIKKSDDQLLRLRKENKRLEMEIFMFRCISGIASLKSFALCDSAEMGWVVNQMLRDIMSRMDALKALGKDGSSSSSAAAPLFLLPPPALLPPLPPPGLLPPLPPPALLPPLPPPALLPPLPPLAPSAPLPPVTPPAAAPAEPAETSADSYLLEHICGIGR